MITNISLLSQGSSEEVKNCIHQLTTSATRLLAECQEAGNAATSPQDQAAVTQRIIQGAYEVAKATKQLVTLFQ